MKKSLIITLAAAAMMLVGANAAAQVSFGFGPATRLYLQKGQDVKYTVGVQVCFEDSRRVSDNFGYSAGVDFGTYGKKDYYGTGVGLSEMYVEIPVRAKLYIPFSDEFQLFFFGGPAPSVCIGSHRVTDAGKTSWFGESSNYSRFDVMAGGGLGMELGECVKLAVGYDHGLLNRYRGEGIKGYSSVAKFSVAYMF